jgi:uncharacterized membrane protein (UPF0127 family)
MKTLELRTVDGRCVARRVRMACSFQSRCVGLLSRRAIPQEEGLLLMPGGSIHTLGMRFTIDVVFLNRQMRILGLAERVPPWRIRVAPRGTGRVLELAAGQIAATKLTTGTYLIVDSTPVEPPDRSNDPTIKLPRPPTATCSRLPIQFSLRLPFERRCAVSSPAKCSRGDGTGGRRPRRIAGRPPEFNQ